MKRIFSILLILYMVLLIGCSAQDKILGTWSTEENVLGGLTAGTEYTFMENGIGKKRTILGVEVDMIYKLNKEENSLVITTSTLGIKTSNTYTYKFEKDVLYLTSETEVLKLVRVVEAPDTNEIQNDDNIESANTQ